MDSFQRNHCKFRRMSMHILSVFAILAMAFPAAKASYAAPAADMDSLIAAAQAEGALTVIALPDQWCNFGEVINGFTAQYDILVNSVSPSASSEDELQAIRDGMQNPEPDTPDVIDVGPGFAVQAKSEGLIAPYQVSAWDTIPHQMKDAEGYWYGDYYGVMSIAANTNVSSPPASWNDLIAGENVGPVALGGDPTVSNLGFFTIYAAALANGGSLDNIEPGLQFFKSLHESGRLLPVIGNGGTLASGETPVLPEWSYLALAQRDANPDSLIDVVVPPNPIVSFYAQAINAYAPHPNAAKLWMEYLYSDAVQLMWLDGYCHPSRFDDLLSRGVIPDDLLARLPDITGAVFPSLEQIAAARDFVNANWACMVYGDCPVPNPRIVASTLGDWLWTTDFIAGPLSLSLYESESGGQGVNLLWSGTQTTDESGFAFVGYDIHGQNFVPGNFLVVSDGVTQKGLVFETVTIEVFDIDNEIMAGTARPGSEVWAAAGPQDWQERVLVVADPVNGSWQADFKTIEFDITEEMRGWSYASVYDEDGDANEGGTPPTPPSTWRDDFEGSLLDGWYWKNGDSDQSNLKEVPGSLRVYASEQGTPYGNLLLRGVANGDFTIKTHVDFMPDTNFQFAGLVIWQDENNFLQFGRAFCDLPDGCVGKGLYFDKIINGGFSDGNFAMPLEDPSDVYLRLERRADAVRALYSVDGGISWYETGTHWIPPDFQVNAVGLVASQDFYTPEAQYPADFEFFELAEGWNFLPEGFHDYDQGDVPSWACNAGGWAADPDDRAADVNINIVVDDQTVASLPAGDFRQDLLDADVCVDGNCSFSTSLWGVILSYEPHRVDTWAQDTTSGEWVLLSNSDKTLTCRTYDIYAYDPLSGEIKQITDLPDTGEYDPSWSPNGKKIVHDVVYGDGSHELYITDVKTQTSTPLLGAEAGGNDAAWSPNGQWIAFDRRWVGEPNIYVVPDTGGIPQLAREDAVLADWAPNSKRLVFQQLSDGSIRTVAVDGGRGGETLIAANGSEPVWSPDGNWIAYESNGNIWKVQVTILGRVLGAPIQVTNLSGWGTGGPTWSLDSQTIIFNGGVGGDFDIWKVSAAGGMPAWLTGAPVFGEYGPANAKNSSMVAYASFSPDGQAARLWVAAYKYDLAPGSWSEGPHSYHFEAQWNGGSETTDEIDFEVSNTAPLYDGYVLFRPGGVRTGLDCAPAGPINPDQPTRFLPGYVTDSPLPYPDAVAYFAGLTANAVWDGGNSVAVTRQEILPFSWDRVDSWFQYACSFTAP